MVVSPVEVDEVEPVDGHEGDGDLEDDEEEEVDKLGGEPFPQRRKSKLLPPATGTNVFKQCRGKLLWD